MQIKMALVAVVLLAPTARAQDDYAALSAEFAAAKTAWLTEKNATEGVPPAVIEPVAEYAPRFVAAATARSGKPEALPYLGWLLTNATRDQATREATEKGVRAQVERLVAEVENGDDSPPVWAKKRYQAAFKMVRHLKYNTVEDEVFAKTVVDLQAVVETVDDELSRDAKAAVFRLTRLQVGMEVPEIQAEDVDGVEFKLSDYRGKVVVIDFWGDW